MFKWIKRFFRNLRARPIPSRTTTPEPNGAQPSYNFIPTFFALVGHNEYDQGANLKYGSKESEWVWNNPVADYILEVLDVICPAIPAYKLLRPVGSYGHQVRSVKKAIKKITNGARSFLASLHFNSGGGVGNENLIAKGTSEIFDNVFADKLSDSLEHSLGITQRRKDGVFEVGDSHNGAGMLNGVRSVGSIGTIIEPGFDHDHEQARAIFGYPKRYARIVAETTVICYLIRGFVEESQIHRELKYWKIIDGKPVVR